MFKRWRWMLGITLVSLVGLVGAQAWGQAPPSQPQGPGQRQQGPGQHQQGPGQHQQGPGQRSGFRGHARPVMGTIASVSGNSFVVTTWWNRSVTVQTTSTTRVLTQQQGILTGLQAGDLVRIMATKSANNGVVAVRLSDTPAALVKTRGGRPSGGPGGSQNGGMHSGLWGGRGSMVMIDGPLAGAPSGGTVTVALPAGPPLAVAVPSTTRITRTVSLPVSGLTAGTHVAVFGAPAAAGGTITAATIYVPGMPAR